MGWYGARRADLKPGLVSVHPAAGPMPINLLAQASTFLANRLIHLRVTGTVRSPTIQVEPIALLAEEAVRFFLNPTALPIR